MVAGNKTILRLIPSGILRPHIQCLIGNGVVLSLPDLMKEIHALEEKNIAVRERLKISAACPLIMPYHVLLDQARELAKGAGKIGTTGRGIGPAYEDKVARRGLRLVDLFNAKRFEEKLKEALDFHNFVLEKYYQQKPLDFHAVLADMLPFAETLKPMTGDIPHLLTQYRAEKRAMLFEGAQGGLLDIDHGTYPFVTSSNTTAGAAATGSGFGLLYFDYVLGIAKAYVTRVGSGPFPTELSDEVGKELAERGHEFGSVTGRPRRCGWFDAVALRRAAQLNSLSGLCINKLDVMDNLKTVKLCVAYELHGEKITDTVPVSAEDYSLCKPIYEEMPGWQSSTHGIKEWDQLPPKAKAYLKRMEEVVGVPIDMVSTGPDREHTIMLKNPFA